MRPELVAFILGGLFVAGASLLTFDLCPNGSGLIRRHRWSKWERVRSGYLRERLCSQCGKRDISD